MADNALNCIIVNMFGGLVNKLGRIEAEAINMYDTPHSTSVEITELVPVVRKTTLDCERSVPGDFCFRMDLVDDSALKQKHAVSSCKLQVDIMT